MSVRHSKVLIDTNVWLDYFLPWRAHADASCRFIELAIKNDCALLYAVHELKDVFYLVANSLKRFAREKDGSLSNEQALGAMRTAWGCAEWMHQNATAIGADGSDVWLAFKYQSMGGDLEDNLLLAAIERGQVDMLVTSDLVLLKKAICEAHTPEDALALMELATQNV